MSERSAPYWAGNVARICFRLEGTSQTGPEPEALYGTPRPPPKATVIPFPAPDKAEGK